MFCENVKLVVLQGLNLDFIQFMVSINFAELGHNVWYISPGKLDKIPNEIKKPEVNVLKLLTFLYLKDVEELSTYLNSIQSWHKIPRLIVISNFEQYMKLDDEHFNSVNAAYIFALLLDAAATCAKKINSTVRILIGCNVVEEKRQIFTNLSNLCASKILDSPKEDSTNNSGILEQILQE